MNIDKLRELLHGPNSVIDPEYLPIIEDLVAVVEAAQEAYDHTCTLVDSDQLDSLHDRLSELYVKVGKA